MNDLLSAKQYLKENNFTCVLIKGDLMFSSDERGVKPLVEFLNSGTDFTGFSAADKVVGKATAFLYALLNVKEVYAFVISESAISVLEQNGIKAEYGEKVKNIINRKGDGICPFEKAMLDITDKFKAKEIIVSKMKEM